MRPVLSIALVIALLPCLGYCQYGGIRAGVLDPERFDMTFTYGGFGVYRLTRYLEVEVGIDYWSKSKDDSYWETSWETSTSDLSVCAYTKYLAPFKGEELIAAFGAGFGAHFVTERDLRMEQGQVIWDEKASNTRPGMHFFIEGGAPLSSTFKISTRFRISGVPEYFRVDLTTGLAFRP
jgi:hypothetical protein